MRIIVDPNVLISYLLTPFPDRQPARLVRAIFEGQCELVVSPLLLNEPGETVSSKPRLNARIALTDLDGFIARLHRIARIVSDLDETIPAVTRDPGDDYLIALAVMEQGDYLVSGDKDLLDLKAFEGVKIVSPADFARILEEA